MNIRFIVLFLPINIYATTFDLSYAKKKAWKLERLIEKYNNTWWEHRHEIMNTADLVQLAPNKAAIPTISTGQPPYKTIFNTIWNWLQSAFQYNKPKGDIKNCFIMYHTSGKTIELSIKDVITTNAYAIVNAANNKLLLGDGVAGSIKKAGGFDKNGFSKIQKECDTIKRTLKKEHFEVGSAVCTSAADMFPRIQYVIHAIAPDCRTDEKNSWQKFMIKTYLSIFETVRKLPADFDKDQVKIAIPALGTGIFGCPKKEATQIASFLAVLIFGPYVNVEFVVFEKESFDLYKNLLIDLEYSSNILNF